MNILSNIVQTLNSYTVSFCQLTAILVIIIGISKALFSFLKDSVFSKDSAEAINESRMELGHAFSLGLGFLIGGSILSTTLAPTWNEIGQLASIIAIRTVLNHFLLKDIQKTPEQIKITTDIEPETPKKSFINKIF
jgi:uncharacterized membrane protein